MTISVGRRDVAWTYFGIVAVNGSNLILLPLVLWALSEQEVGLWFVFSSIALIASVLDLGLGTTMSRHVAFVWSGATRISAQGYETVASPDTPNLPLLWQLLRLLRWIYAALAALCAVVLVPLATWHVVTSADSELVVDTALWAWAAFALALLLNVGFSYWTPLLKGVGRVAESQQAIVGGKITQLVLTALLLLAGAGLLGVSLGYLGGTICSRVLSVRAFRRAVPARESSTIEYQPPARDLLQILWPNSWRQGIVSLTQYANSAVPVLLASILLGLEVAASVGLTYQVIGLIKVFSNSTFNAYVPLFARLRAVDARDELKVVFARSLGVSVLLYACGAAALIALGPLLLRLLDTQVVLLSGAVLSILLASELLINIAALSSGFVATANRVPMAIPFGAATILGLGVAWVWLQWFDGGVTALVLPPALAWLVYNDWAWFGRAAADLRATSPQLSAACLRETMLFVRRAIGRQ